MVVCFLLATILLRSVVTSAIASTELLSWWLEQHDRHAKKGQYGPKKSV